MAAELPLQAIAEMMGIPIEDRAKIFEWTNMFIGREDPDMVAGPEEVTQAAVELYSYSHQLQTDRRGRPAEDIVTTLLTADLDGEGPQRERVRYVLPDPVGAGNETTRNSITRGMMAFFDFGDQWAKFRRRPRPAHGHRGGGDRAVGHPGAALPPPGREGLRTGRGADRGGRQGGDVAHRRQP